MSNKITKPSKYGWTKTGAKVWVEYCFDNGKCLVRSALESVYDYDGDEQEVLGELRIVDDVWDTAPTEVYDKRIRVLEKKIVELERDVVQKQLSIKEMDAQIKNQELRYKAIPELRQLDQFIAGKITHYVHIRKWRSPRITAFSEEASEYSDREYGLDKMRLLTLYGLSKGNLEWRLNEYSSHSMQDDIVIPCCSLEDAKAALQVEFDKRFDEPRAGEELLKDAEAAGVVIPDAFRERIRAAKIASAQKTVDKLSAQVIEANKKLIETQEETR